MGRRRAMRISVRDIARLAGIGYRTALADEKRGMFVYGDVDSVFEYIESKHGREKQS